MDPFMIFLRIVHILFDALWLGGGIFLTFVLGPRLKAIGPPVAGQVFRSVVPVAAMVFTVSSGLVIATGVTMALKVKWNVLDTFFTSRWGYAILIGFIATVLAFIIGPLVAKRTADKIVALLGSMQGGPPTPKQAQELGGLQQRFNRAGIATVSLLLVAMGAMSAARFLGA